MHRPEPHATIVARLDLSGIPIGPVLKPMERVPDAERELFAAWEAPLSPWGGFNVGSGLECADDDGIPVLAFVGDGRTFTDSERWERAIVARGLDLRDGTLAAEVNPLAATAAPSDDIAVRTEALVGVVFRMETSRRYYQFAIEGRRRAVLFRRNDDEWFVLSEQPIDAPSGYVTLEVRLDGDAIRCSCAELGVAIHVSDTLFRSGKVGLRAVNQARVRRFEVTQTDGQRSRGEGRLAQAASELSLCGADIPDATVVRTYRTADLGGGPTFCDFIEQGRFDLLVQGKQLRALTPEGNVIWEVPEKIVRCVFSRDCGPNGRFIYGFAGKREERRARDVSGGEQTLTVENEMVVVEGRTGAILARAQLPPNVTTQRFFDWAPRSAALVNTDGTDIVLREWRDDLGGGGVRLWAYDRNLNLLWAHIQSGAHYGHHYALDFHDVDSDGREELLAGGVLYRGDGTVIWTHDRADELQRIYGASHYDAVLLGDLAGEAEDDPTAFLMAGSAGLYGVDALTGVTRVNHRIGHAQGRAFGKVRPDLPGTEVLAVTRWGNFGILTLFSGRGERLWTIQPDYVGQGATPVVWGKAGHRLIWTNTSRDAQAFYDGHGRLVKRLPELSRIWGNRMNREVGRAGSPVRIGTDPTDYLTLTVDGVLHVFGPAE
jgi:outer membrane protein assembly factor BamB